VSEHAQATKLLRERAGADIEFAIVLGTGLSQLVSDRIENASRVPYEELGFPPTHLFGHAGEALVGRWQGRTCLAFAGRFHLYQGFDAQMVTAQVALAHECGAGTVLLTNAAGGLNEHFVPGDLMLIVDQINLTGTSPLIGADDPNPFVDMSAPYDAALCEIARKSAAHLGIGLREGVYAGLIGPAFETKAEARWLRSIADAVGMSTVLETILARRLGMRVLGMSLITNMVAENVSHGDVVASAHARAPEFARLLEAIVEAL
jgi:purine-nucleoside phosphorylase